MWMLNLTEQITIRYALCDNWEGHYKNAKDETKATYSPSHLMIGPVIL